MAIPVCITFWPTRPAKSFWKEAEALPQDVAVAAPAHLRRQAQHQREVDQAGGPSRTDGRHRSRVRRLHHHPRRRPAGQSGGAAALRCRPGGENDLVSGWKKERHDSVGKTLPSLLFNHATAGISGIPLHDFNCGYKPTTGRSSTQSSSMANSTVISRSLRTRSATGRQDSGAPPR